MATSALVDHKHVPYENKKFPRWDSNPQPTHDSSCVEVCRATFAPRGNACEWLGMSKLFIAENIQFAQNTTSIFTLFVMSALDTVAPPSPSPLPRGVALRPRLIPIPLCSSGR